jgi:hypothetical protein
MSRCPSFDKSRCAGDVRVKSAVVIAVLLCGTGVAIAQDGSPAKPAKSSHGAQRPQRPLPVVIPQQFAPPQEAYASLPESAAAAGAAKPSACQVRLGKLATFQPLPILVGPGDCGAVDAVQMDAIILPDQTKVAVAPPATMRCPMAEAVATWVREDVVSTLKTLPPLRALDNFDSYSCRGRNNVRAAQLSEHGKADALDVRDFKLADGHELNLTDIHADKNWREAIKASVCARFSTVLGPGSDGYHEEHIHLDLEERRNNYKICQWDVRVPPPEAQSGKQDNKMASATGDTAVQASGEAAIPLDEVPLPRPRPVAQIERSLSGRRVTPQ